MNLKLFLQHAAKSHPWLKVLLPLLILSLFMACKEQNPYNPYIYTEEQREEQKRVDEQVIRKYFRANQTGAHSVDTTKVERTASGLYYLQVEEGTGPEIKSGATVDVHYIGRFTSNTKFDSSYDRAQTFAVTVDRSDVIKGWHEGLKLMRGGETARFFIPSYLAYGYRGSGSIPPNTVLAFEIKVERVR